MQELPQIRIATLDDEPALIEQTDRLHRENGLFDLDRDKVRTLMRHCYARQDADEPLVLVAVIDGPKGIEASTCLRVAEFYYTNSWHLGELWNFVDEEYRRSRNAEALIRFGDEVARKMGIPFFTGPLTNRRMAGKVRLYRRILGDAAGAFFFSNAPWKAEPIVEHGDLCKRLRECAAKCTNGGKMVTFEVAKKEVAPLLREAAAALASEDNIWAPAKRRASAA